MRNLQTVTAWPLALLVFSLAATTLAVTQYNYQIIAVMDVNWIELQVAEFLYNKNPGVSTLVLWNKPVRRNNEVQPGFYTHLKGIEIDETGLDFRTARIQVVGHGTVRNGERLMGRQTHEEIANALNALYPQTRRATNNNGERINSIARISLVGCECALDVNNNSPASETFAGKLIKELNVNYAIDTEITARTTLVTVDSTGRKLTGTTNDDRTITWKRGNPAAKKLFTLDEQGNVVAPNNAAAEGDSITCRACGITSNGCVGDANSGIIVTVRQDGVDPQRVRLTQRALYDMIDSATRSIFNSAAVDGNGNPLRTSELRRYIVRERVGNNANYQDQVRKVREFNSLIDFVNEINFFGRRGHQILQENQAPQHEYYLFGKYVIRMQTNDFYINAEGYMGVALINVPNDVPENVPEQTKSQLIEQSSLRNLETEQIPIIGERYWEMIGVHNDFMGDMRKLMNGQGGEITVDFTNADTRISKATSAQRIFAMTLSEPIRNFRAHPVNMIALDLNAHGFLSHQQFFHSHPMARAETWPPNIDSRILTKPTGFAGSYGDYSWGQVLTPQTGTLNSRQRKNARLARERVVNFFGSWLSNVDQGRIKIERNSGNIFIEKYQGTANPTLTIDVVGDNAFRQAIANVIKETVIVTFRENTAQSNIIIQNPNSIDFPGLLRSSREPMIETPELQVVEFKEEIAVNINSRTLPLVASETLRSDQESIAHQITSLVQELSNQDRTEYSVVKNSVEHEENEIRFRVIDRSEPPNTREMIVEVDEEKLGLDDVIEDMKGGLDEEESKSPGASSSGGSKLTTAKRVGTFLAIAGTTQGLFQSIGALEDGETKEGLIGLSMSLHDIGDLSGINERIYQSAGKTVGSIFRKDAGSIATDVSESVEATRAIAAADEEAVSFFGRAAREFSLIGTAFGAYSMYEDYSKHSVIGYIDLGIDAVITGLSPFAFNPYVETAVVALTAIRMVIDDFYENISQELDSLPPDATTRQKVDAFFKGFSETIVNILEEWSLEGQIYSAIMNSDKLDKEYDRDRDFLRTLSDYQNYYSVMTEEGTSVEQINFADGSAAWNGGDITFTLGDSNFAHIQLQEIVDQDGNQRSVDVDIPRHPNLQDIVMGIGESHSISFTTISVKFFWFVPVDTKTVISGLEGDRSSLHGTYYGNSQNNQFFAVQQRPPDLNYQLEDYYYNLYGRDGNDTFYLGPQHTYVEGNEGEDTYYISESSTHTDINNFARDRITDYLITTSEFLSLRLSRTGFNLHITSTDGHNITIFDWFRGVLYRHMNFRSGDGFLFWITVNEMGEAMMETYAWTKADSSEAVTLDLSQTGDPFESAITLVGSTFDDMMIGNDRNNHLLTSSGNDVMHGGEGKDSYNIEAMNGSLTINNFAQDEQQDFLYFRANHDEIVAQVQENDILIFKRDNSLSVTLQNWFVNSSYQHLLLVSNDAVVSQIATDPSNPEHLHMLFVDMDLIQGPKVLNMSIDEVSVIGSNEADRIRGNKNNNYFAPGLGDDYIEGGEGPDMYVIRPGEGNDVIYNLALDGQQDKILFGANWMEIQLTNESDDLILSVYAKNMSIRLLRWFQGENFQHITVRSMDGVVFTLPSSSDNLVKTPIVIDKGESPVGIKLDIEESPWKNVTSVSGSNFEDAISGNEQDSYMDPGSGQAFLRGRDGHDTYVIRANYSEGNRIYNIAEDEQFDTLMFLVPYSHIVVQKQACSIVLSSNLTSGATTVLLVDFMLSSKEQHLMITSSDGISFLLPESTDYQPVPIIINLATESRGQIVNLTEGTRYASVRTVYGSINGSNHLVGNEQNNTLVGGNKCDMLFGNDGNDVLKGGGDNDMLYGGSGNDILNGENGDDILEGGDGDDTLAPGVGRDIVNGGNGTDSVLCIGNPATATGSFIDLYNNISECNSDSSATLISIEGAHGSPYNDNIRDDFEDNILVGGGGNDTIWVSVGYDVLQGGPGHDVYDLSSATGTKIINNFAADLKTDTVNMQFTQITLNGVLLYNVTKRSLRYSRSYDNLIVRIALSGYPEGFFDAFLPTVIISKWYQSDRYKHIQFNMDDGIVTEDVIEAYASQLHAFTFATDSDPGNLLPLSDNNF